ncbi:ABC transporter ATP-binding protein [Fructobacillus papyrifericola]|uniref:ABC transporter ATP-binding protein n=1 Tax=Fructobacillus papyrifericola TaxID=2713172 RepID=A0ABS5QSX5_9LACO|nr:ABC transporter ATP-binding protein [Fructobacillus papyrifericola]MBS9336037.1 ABC transporter ATP-binding protein [Fructobacillus papyrifericola]
MTLEVKNLSFAYHDEALFRDFSMVLSPGDFTLLMGPSGCGKSSLLKALAGLYPQYGGKLSGSVQVAGQNLSKQKANLRAKSVGLLFQNPREQFAMPTVEEEFIFTMENLGMPANQMAERIDWALKRVGMTEFRQRVLAELSGGEMQKVALAEVLLTGAKYLLLDEPFAAVDEQSRKDMQQLLFDLSRDGYAILVSDHDASGYLDKMNRFFQYENERFVQKDSADWPREKRTQAYPFHKAGAGKTLFDLTHLRIENDQRLLLEQEKLELKAGDFTLITGPNGSGKSSFLKCLARLQKAEGDMSYLDQDFHKWKKRDYYRQVTMALQSSLDQFLNITVEEELQQVLNRTYQKSYWQKERLAEALSLLGLTGLEKRSVYTLSGGQQKKLQLLLMMVMASPVLLLDEPLAGLDQKSTQVLLALLQKMTKELQLTILVVSHQIEQLLPLVNRHLQLIDGQLVDQGEVVQ